MFCGFDKKCVEGALKGMVKLIAKIRDFLVNLPKGAWIAIIAIATFLLLSIAIKTARRKREEAEDRSHYLYWCKAKGGYIRYAAGATLNMEKKFCIHNQPEKTILIPVSLTNDGNHAYWCCLKCSICSTSYKQGVAYDHPDSVARMVTFLFGTLVKAAAENNGTFSDDVLNALIEAATAAALEKGITVDVTLSPRADVLSPRQESPDN